MVKKKKIPPGDYDVEFVKAGMFFNKKGNLKVSIEVKISKGKFKGRKII